MSSIHWQHERQQRAGSSGSGNFGGSSNSVGRMQHQQQSPAMSSRSSVNSHTTTGSTSSSLNQPSPQERGYTFAEPEVCFKQYYFSMLLLHSALWGCMHYLEGLHALLGGIACTTWRGCMHYLEGLHALLGGVACTTWRDCMHYLEGLQALLGGVACTTWRGCRHFLKGLQINCACLISLVSFALVFFSNSGADLQESMLACCLFCCPCTFMYKAYIYWVVQIINLAVLNNPYCSCNLIDEHIRCPQSFQCMHEVHTHVLKIFSLLPNLL